MSGTRLGMVRCEHCCRQFNPHSGARHIPWCAKQQSEIRKHKLSTEKQQALERYRWRISYRPSNQMSGAANNLHHHHQFKQKLQQQQQLQRRQTNRLGDLNERLKKSSLNSSATFSSPSASSTNSIGTGSIISGFSGHENQQQPVGRNHQPAKNPARQPSSPGKLKRSISSLTLTKQAGVSSKDCNGDSGSRAAHQAIKSSACQRPGESMHTGQLRTKSVNDLNAQHMDEIVETLTKRMDEIYAQNQVLLAGILKTKEHSRNSNLLNRSGGNARSLNTDNARSDSDDFDGQDSDNLVMCHHCKANCIEEANYCHKCGCKVRATFTSSPSPG